MGRLWEILRAPSVPRGLARRRRPLRRSPRPAPTASWSMQSGPGKVAFADARSLVTTATFSAPGLYVLKLTADNGQTSASSTLNVEVEICPSGEAT